MVDLSTTEAEYILLYSSTCQGIWLNKMLNKCEVEMKDSFVLWCENKSFIAIDINPFLHGRTKHMDMKLYFVRNQVAKKLTELKYCNTEFQLAYVYLLNPYQFKSMK